MSVFYEEIRALIDPEQSDVSPDGALAQDISVILIQDAALPRQERWREPAVVTMSAREARELAFELLSLAEQAERIGGRR